MTPEEIRKADEELKAKVDRYRPTPEEEAQINAFIAEMPPITQEQYEWWVRLDTFRKERTNDFLKRIGRPTRTLDIPSYVEWCAGGRKDERHIKEWVLAAIESRYNDTDMQDS